MNLKSQIRSFLEFSKIEIDLDEKFKEYSIYMSRNNNEILHIIARGFHIEEYKLRAITRRQAIAEARIFAYWYLTTFRNLSLKGAAIKLNRRNHTTVLYGIRRFKELYDIDEEYRGKVDEIMKILGH